MSTLNKQRSVIVFFLIASIMSICIKPQLSFGDEIVLSSSREYKIQLKCSFDQKETDSQPETPLSFDNDVNMVISDVKKYDNIFGYKIHSYDSVYRDSNYKRVDKSMQGAINFGFDESHFEISPRFNISAQLDEEKNKINVSLDLINELVQVYPAVANHTNTTGTVVTIKHEFDLINKNGSIKDEVYMGHDVSINSGAYQFGCRVNIRDK